MVRGIDGHGLVREEGIEGRKAALHERRRGFVVLEVDPVQKMRPVPGVGFDRRREPLLREVGRDPLRRGERCVVFFIRGRDPARPDRVDVDREPAAADDVGVGRGGVFAGKAHLDPVCPPGEEGRVHAVRGDIDPGDRRIGVEGFDGPGEYLVVVEVTGVGGAVGERPDLDHAFCGGEDSHRPANLLTHMPTSHLRCSNSCPAASRSPRQGGGGGRSPPPRGRPGGN